MSLHQKIPDVCLHVVDLSNVEDAQFLESFQPEDLSHVEYPNDTAPDFFPIMDLKEDDLYESGELDLHLYLDNDSSSPGPSTSGNPQGSRIPRKKSRAKQSVVKKKLQMYEIDLPHTLNARNAHRLRQEKKKFLDNLKAETERLKKRDEELQQEAKEVLERIKCTESMLEEIRGERPGTNNTTDLDLLLADVVAQLDNVQC